jgi:hypothetical protein
MGFVLFIVAILLSLALYPIGLGYAIFKKGLNEYFYDVAYGIDQLGNIIMKHAFNKWLISDGGYQFGNPDETVSSVLGKNKRKKTLTKSGKLLDWILNKLDNGHSLNSIEENP